MILRTEGCLDYRTGLRGLRVERGGKLQDLDLGSLAHRGRGGAPFFPVELRRLVKAHEKKVKGI